MIFFRKAWRFLLLAGCGLMLVGCWRSYDSPSDEQSEANYSRGRNLVASGDYRGAVEAFERALEVNPRNASAHFELAILFEQQLKDYVSAMYHGARFCRMRPASEEAKLVRQRLDSCMLELVKNVPVGPVTPQLQREIEKLNRENKNLHQQIATLTENLALANQRQTIVTNVVVTQMVAAAQAPLAGDFTPAPAAGGRKPTRLAPAKIPPAKAPTRALTPPTREATPPVRASASTFGRTHTVRANDTLASVARQYGVSVKALQKANLSANAREIRPGQVLRIPGPNER